MEQHLDFQHLIVRSRYEIFILFALLARRKSTVKEECDVIYEVFCVTV